MLKPTYFGVSQLALTATTFMTKKVFQIFVWCVARQILKKWCVARLTTGEAGFSSEPTPVRSFVRGGPWQRTFRELGVGVALAARFSRAWAGHLGSAHFASWGRVGGTSWQRTFRELGQRQKSAPK